MHRSMPIACLSLALAASAAPRAGADAPTIPPPPDPKYQQVWVQDFSTRQPLAVAAHDIGSGAWIAHTPTYTDWFTFQDPGEPFHPFGLGNGYLTIRVQKDGHDPNNWFAGYSGGLLSSMDGHGKGFAQQYGYFEASMQTPGTPNTWPAFWLEDAPTVTDKSLPDGAEIDVTESYGNFGTGPGQKPPGKPDEDGVAWHNWGHNGNPTKSDGTFALQPGLATGFHTYGVDVEPDTITWYVDRRKIWQAPTFSAARRPLYVMVNLALGGGTHNNADGSAYDWSLTPIPTDLRVKYIAVWASPNSPNYRGKPGAPTALTAIPASGKVKLDWAGGGQSFAVYRGTRAGHEDSRPIATGLTDSTFLDTAVTNGKRYFYRVEAVNSFGASPRSSEIAALPDATAGSSALFVKIDSTTRGNWKGVYGADGYRVMGVKGRKSVWENLPAYAAVSASTDQTFTWAPSTDPRALLRDGAATDRIVAELHTDPTLTLDIELTDGKPHPVALYFLDWDRKGEVNSVAITDAVFGNILDSRNISDFSGGVYAVWNLKGHVKITITNAAPKATNSQATVSGVFFGRPAK